jgi:hypothetical protein
VKRAPLIWIASVTFAVAGAACSSTRAEDRGKVEAVKGSGDSVTIAGCLSTDSQGHFALTAAPDAAAAALAARSTEIQRDTHIYMLNGGNDLQSHLGKRVEVTGSVEGKKIEYENTDKAKTEQQPATGGDHNDPVIKTKEAVDLESRQLMVQSVRDVEGSCTITP